MESLKTLGNKAGFREDVRGRSMTWKVNKWGWRGGRGGEVNEYGLEGSGRLGYVVRKGDVGGGGVDKGRLEGSSSGLVDRSGRSMEWWMKDRKEFIGQRAWDGEWGIFQQDEYPSSHKAEVQVWKLQVFDCTHVFDIGDRLTDGRESCRRNPHGLLEIC